MFVSVLILLFKAWGDCVNPTDEDCAGKTSSQCNAGGTGCRYEAGNAGTCSAPSADTCAAKAASSSCNSEGCTWSSNPACVRTSHPACSETAGVCSQGCESGPERTRCVTQTEACARHPVGSCATDDYSCKVENSKCVAKTSLDYQDEQCLGPTTADACQLKQECHGPSVCSSGGVCTCSSPLVTVVASCKLVGGVCKGRTDEELQAAVCAYQGVNGSGSGGCDGNPECKESGSNCVVKTPQEILDWQCANEVPFANCSQYAGACQVVGNVCKGDPAYLNTNDDVICSLDAAGTGCADYNGCTILTDYPCVLSACTGTGTACTSASAATGCTWQASGSCGVNTGLSCGSATAECGATAVTAGCVSTAPVTAACLPNPELEGKCAGAGRCSSSADNQGCKTVTNNDDGSSASAIAVPVMVFVVLALFL